MNRFVIIFCIGFVIGCDSNKPKRADKVLSKSDLAALRSEFSEPRGAGVQIDKTYPVVQGVPPLAHIVIGDSSVRVVDMTSGIQIASGEATRSSVVSVDAARGVTIGGERVNTGPLPMAHQYGIYVERNNADTRIVTGAANGAPTATQPAK